MIDNNIILTAENLRVYFPVRSKFLALGDHRKKQFVKAVDGISFSLRKGEILAFVGESGCGKTTVGNALIGLVPVTDGRVMMGDVNLSNLPFEELRQYRKRIQYIFQDPYSSLNPRMTVRQTIQRSMEIHDICPASERENGMLNIMQKVGLPGDYADRFPHEFSGGQRQRIAIARALAVEPDIIIADEPTAALDVSIQAQILNLLLQLKEELGLTIIFISHDLSVVNYISNRIAVMYLGRIVEEGNSRDILGKPLHPYTQALIEAVPKRIHGHTERKVRLTGTVPSPIDLPSGCVMHERCPFAMERCVTEVPSLLPKDHRLVSCHLYN
ncbi:MAG: ATP-binding cassette domain-containing protein [Leptolinea sp.]|nr:ATP-binding cassette domain-containing protein [Leptolinea sp.]